MRSMRRRRRRPRDEPSLTTTQVLLAPDAWFASPRRFRSRLRREPTCRNRTSSRTWSPVRITGPAYATKAERSRIDGLDSSLTIGGGSAGQEPRQQLLKFFPRRSRRPQRTHVVSQLHLGRLHGVAHDEVVGQLSTRASAARRRTASCSGVSRRLSRSVFDAIDLIVRQMACRPEPRIPPLRAGQGRRSRPQGQP